MSKLLLEEVSPTTIVSCRKSLRVLYFQEIHKEANRYEFDMTTLEERPKLIVGVDFGTTFSG